MKIVVLLILHIFIFSTFVIANDQILADKEIDIPFLTFSSDLTETDCGTKINKTSKIRLRNKIEISKDCQKDPDCITLWHANNQNIHEKVIEPTKRLKNLIEASKDCKKDSDCTTLFTGEFLGELACKTFPIRKDAKIKFHKLMDTDSGACNEKSACFERCTQSSSKVFCNKGVCEF